MLFGVFYSIEKYNEDRFNINKDMNRGLGWEILSQIIGPGNMHMVRRIDQNKMRRDSLVSFSSKILISLAI